MSTKERDIRIAIEQAVLKIANPNVKQSAIPARYVTGTPDLYLGEFLSGITTDHYVVSADLASGGSLVSSVNAIKAVLSENFTASSTTAITLGAALTAGSVTATVGALAFALPKGTRLYFLDTTNKEVVLSADAAVGATSLSIYPATQAIANGSAAAYQGKSVGLWLIAGSGNGTLKVFTKTLPNVSGKGYKKGSFVVKTVTASTGVFGAEILTANNENVFVSNQATAGIVGSVVDGVVTLTFTTAPASGVLVLVDYLVADTAYAGYTDANNKQAAPGSFGFEFDSLTEDYTYLVQASVSRQVKMSK